MATVERIPAFSGRREVRRTTRKQEDQASKSNAIGQDAQRSCGRLEFCVVMMLARLRSRLGKYHNRTTAGTQAGVVVPAQEPPVTPPATNDLRPVFSLNRKTGFWGSLANCLNQVCCRSHFEELQSRLPRKLTPGHRRTVSEVNPSALTLSDVIASVYSCLPNH